MDAKKWTLRLACAAPLLFFSGLLLARDGSSVNCVEEQRPGGPTPGCYSGLELALGVERPLRLNTGELVVGVASLGLGALSFASALVVGVVGLAARHRRAS